MRNGRKRDKDETRPEPETGRDFFDLVCDEVSTSMRAGRRFAPEAIERTFSKVGGRR
jgi:hypothetical protein